MKNRWLAFAMLAAGCASRGENAGDAQPAGDPAPWTARALSRAEVPAVYVTTWSAAQNRNTCALIAFDNTAPTRNATARAATFSGGWAVAYDRADQRSAFGIAGTGSRASDATYSWPDNITWSDGSTASYGLEGGTGPNYLAYLRISGQGCLYNVWSRLGRGHLEDLLRSIRFVQP